MTVIEIIIGPLSEAIADYYRARGLRLRYLCHSNGQPVHEVRP